MQQNKSANGIVFGFPFPSLIPRLQKRATSEIVTEIERLEAQGQFAFKGLHAVFPGPSWASSNTTRGEGKCTEKDCKKDKKESYWDTLNPAIWVLVKDENWGKVDVGPTAYPVYGWISEGTKDCETEF